MRWLAIRGALGTARPTQTLGHFADAEWDYDGNARCPHRAGNSQCANGNPRALPREWLSAHSDFELRPSFGFRTSDFGFTTHSPHGTAIVSNNCFTSTSLVISSASASKVVMMRWRSTSGAMLF